jgi:hypothetical protein
MTRHGVRLELLSALFCARIFLLILRAFPAPYAHRLFYSPDRFSDLQSIHRSARTYGGQISDRQIDHDHYEQRLPVYKKLFCMRGDRPDIYGKDIYLINKNTCLDYQSRYGSVHQPLGPDHPPELSFRKSYGLQATKSRPPSNNIAGKRRFTP